MKAPNRTRAPSTGRPAPGLALVPLRLYFRDGRAKMELGLGRGKTLYDKRRTLVERDARREAERAMKVSRRR